MAYTIMLWLIQPGSQAHEPEAMQMLDKHNSLFPDAYANKPPATHLIYGVYQDSKDARRALEKITDHLEEQDPIEVELEEGTIFLIPASRIHYVVMSEIEGPKEKED